MSMSEELGRLAELHQRGVLNDDEYSRAKAKVIELGGRPAPGVGPGPQGWGAAAGPVAALNGLARSRSDAWLGGVCGGLAQLSGLASWAWRLGFVLLALCAGGGVLLYGLLWLLLPATPATTYPAPSDPAYR